MITVDCCCRQRCRPYHTSSYGWWVGILIMMVVLQWKPTSPLVLRSRRSVFFMSSFRRSSPTITAVLSVPTWKMGQANHILQDKVQFSSTYSRSRSCSMVLPAVVPLKYNYDYFEEQEKGFGAKDYIPPYEDERDQDDDDGGSNRETCFVYMTTTTTMTSAPERSKNPTVKPSETRTTINTKDDFQNQKQSSVFSSSSSSSSSSSLDTATRTEFTNRASFKPSSIPPSS